MDVLGLDHVDLQAAAARGLPVGHTPGVLVETTADLAFALLLGAARRTAEGDRMVRGGEWGTWEPDLLLGRDVAITRIRGNWHEYKGIPLMPTLHPAFVLRQYTEQNRRFVWQDLKAAHARSVEG